RSGETAFDEELVGTHACAQGGRRPPMRHQYRYVSALYGPFLLTPM
ncbi:MAG: hypothetical protein JWP29_663, partial [Rhodoferax sp.]|nr:hypothetical protein [Rhodoferax sp.]